MTLNKREKTIAMVVGAVMVLFVGYQFVLAGLYLGPLDGLNKEIARKKQQQQTENALLANREKVKAEFAKLEQSGLTTDTTAVSAIRDRILQIGQQNGIQLQFNAITAVPNPRSDFDEVPFVFPFNTTSVRLWSLIHALEVSGLPIRVDSVNVKSKKEGQDDLTVELKIAIILYSPKGTNTRIAASRPAATTRPITRGPGMAAPLSNPTPASAPAAAGGAAVAPTGAAANNEPPIVDIEAQMRARRARDQGGAPVAVETPAATPTNTTTQPAGGAR